MLSTSDRLVRSLVVIPLVALLWQPLEPPQLPASPEELETSAPATTIRVKVATKLGPVRQALMGVNHRFGVDGFRIWDTVNDRPEPAAVAGLRRAGVSLIRYPGGTVANLFDWSRSVGPTRGCQVDGHVDEGALHPVRGGRRYGLDEHMRLVEAAGAEAVMTVPFAAGTPESAANWVEYMNSPANDPGNPGGGVDWADVRATNGHPSPYAVRHWEVGNEQRLPGQRYWMSADTEIALDQYVSGGESDVADEALGQQCRHPVEGVASDGTRNQTFEMRYPPVAPRGEKITVDGRSWRRVDDLAAADPNDSVYEFHSAQGDVVFGNGRHGAIPPAGSVVRASYRSVHAGVFEFMRAMQAVDPTIQTCVTWGLKEFVEAAEGRPYDCFAVHAYTHFKRDDHNSWDSPLQGHDLHMLGTRSERKLVARLMREVPAGTAVPLSEFGQIWGDTEAFPTWASSMTDAVYMASQWAAWTRLGVPWATGNDLLARNTRGMLGPSPDFTFTAEAVARQSLAAMFAAGGSVVAVDVDQNPVRESSVGNYRALETTATQSRRGDVFVVVVNRLPHARQAVTARIELPRFRAASRARVWRVSAPSFQAANLPNQPAQVTLSTSTRGVGQDGFAATFPAHSITVFKLSSR